MAEEGGIVIALEGNERFTGHLSVIRHKIGDMEPRQRSPGEEAVIRRYFTTPSLIWPHQRAAADFMRRLEPR